MKRFLLSICAIFFISNLLAQPMFTSADMPNIGDHDSIMVIQYHPITNNLDTETGMGYSWDFSGLPFHVHNMIDVDSFRAKKHPVSSPFTHATIEEYSTGVTGQNVNLYSYSNDTLYLHRTGSISGGFPFVPPIASMAFPLSFNNSTVINASIYYGATLVGERKTTTLYDGFGTLRMPNNKNYDNVFRIKQTERDTTYNTGFATTYTTYIWYKQGGQVPLLRLRYTGSSNLYFVFGSKANKITTGIEDQSELTRFTVYPNPSNNNIYIQSQSNTLGMNFVISNITGKQLIKGKLSTETTPVDLSPLPAGVYFLQVGQQNGNSIKVIKY